jgi:hypothetical protein
VKVGTAIDGGQVVAIERSAWLDVFFPPGAHAVMEKT